MYFVKLAISRVLYQLVAKSSSLKLKSEGFLSRDCRCIERKSSILYFNKDSC